MILGNAILRLWRRRHRQPFLTSLGLAVIDEIHFGSERVVEGVLGGSASYCTVGARLFLAPPTSKQLTWLVRAGKDFPLAAENMIEEWQIGFSLQKLPQQLSTRGLLKYEDDTFGPKMFKYTAPVIAVKPHHLHGTDMLFSQSFHFLAFSGEIKNLVDGLIKLRKPSNLRRPLIIWEPAPPGCLPQNLSVCLDDVKSVDVFSPNHLELLAFFGRRQDTFDTAIIEHLASRFLDACNVRSATQNIIVVRAGEYGCMVVTRSTAPTWIPPYYKLNEQGKFQRKIVDPTGAGNAFLGGFAIGYLETGDVVEAAKYGTVAASFALEQIGVPTLNKNEHALVEYWNGVSPRARLNEFRRALSQ